jgi:hypothetical protein
MVPVLTPFSYSPLPSFSALGTIVFVFISQRKAGGRTEDTEEYRGRTLKVLCDFCNCRCFVEGSLRISSV